MKTHLLEGRKREEWVGELGNVARHRGLADGRGGRGRNAFVSSETWQVTNKDTSWRGGRGRKREEGDRELRNMARHK
jgi:hypothetical protein